MQRASEWRRKVLLFVLQAFLFLISFGAYAQPDSGCHPPQLVSVNVVHYLDYAKALIRFRTPKLSTRVLVQDENGNAFGEYHVSRSSGQLYLTNLPQNRIFTVWAEDYCGEMRTLARFETFPGVDYGGGISVSKAMFEVLEEFMSQADEGLVSFLAHRDELPVLERVAFLQQYLLDGEPFMQDYGQQWPPEAVFAVADTEECRCKFVLQRTQNVEAGSLMGGTIVPFPQSSSGDLGDPDALYEFAGVWAGPAKDLSLYTQGCRTGNGHFEYSFDESNEEQAISANHAELAYAFLCINYEQLPRGCACADKCVYLGSDYLTSLYTEITKDAGWCVTIGNKAAWADAEDFAVLIKEEADSLEVLAAGQAHVSAYAEVTANPQFWLAPLNIAQLVLSDWLSGDSTNFNVLLENLAEAIKNMLSVKAWEHTGTWGIKDKRTALIAVNDRKFCFPPNHPVRFHLYSASWLRSGGKRKWRSWASVRSAFQMSAVVHADATPPEACCTDQFGNWMAKGFDELFNSEYVLSKAAADLALWPWDGWNFYQPLPGEYGELMYSIGCEPGLQGPPIGWLQAQAGQQDGDMGQTPLPEPTDPDRVGTPHQATVMEPPATKGQAPVPLSWPCRLYVYDLTGRLVWSGVEAWPRPVARIVEDLRASGWLDAGKVYVFHWRSYHATKTEKVFVH